MEKEFLLPVGFKLEDGTKVKKLPVAETRGDSEEVFTSKPTEGKLYKWFGQIIAAAVKMIGSTPISRPFLDKYKDDGTIPPLVRKIPLMDVGTLLLQIQTECWEDVIENQTVLCQFCGNDLKADIHLREIEIPFDEDFLPETFDVRLDDTYVINTGVEALSAYEGQSFNAIEFRVATLDDAIKHQTIASDEIMFWRRIAFDTMVALCFVGEDGKKIYVDDGYIGKRGTLLFNKDLSTKTLRLIRDKIQSSLPSAKFYYEKECPCPRKKMIAYFTDVTNFFR